MIIISSKQKIRLQRWSAGYQRSSPSSSASRFVCLHPAAVPDVKLHRQEGRHWRAHPLPSHVLRRRHLLRHLPVSHVRRSAYNLNKVLFAPNGVTYPVADLIIGVGFFILFLEKIVMRIIDVIWRRTVHSSTRHVHRQRTSPGVRCASTVSRGSSVAAAKGINLAVLLPGWR